ncbi:MAG: hybrid sensor histidine kinase/response regulator [Gemmatimonadetes bacterium]|nr:MAG: hybrid sensor histidine kinase/response regulator [Gemmatimonadota bacterium]
MEPEREPLRVLIVEDSEADYELMVHALRRDGSAVTAVRVDHLAALTAALQSFRADVVLTDHALPQTSGLDVLRLIQREQPLLPVLIVTGSIDEETAADYIKAGAADYVVKQRLHRLGPAVRRALALKDALREAMDAGAASAATERRFRSLIEHSTDVITLLDAAGTILYSTQSLKPTLGYDAGEMTGHSVLDLVHPDEQAAAASQLARLYQHPEEIVQAGFRVRHKDGSWRDLEVVIANRLDDPSIRALVVNYRDVTDRKRAEEALRLADERLRAAQRMEAVGRLAAGIAHDFNNLLTAILGSTDLLLEGLPADHPAREDALESRQAALRAADLTRQLLAFSRQQVLAPRTLDLNAVVRDVERLLRRLIGEDVKLRTVLAANLAPVRADPTQLEQVLVNLAVNARDAMPRGGTLTIETANVALDDAYVADQPVVAAGDYAMIAIGDTGTGMDAATRARVFEPFFTTKQRGKGTGLGLATVYGIVKQSGGYIWVYSELGVGTTFKVYLPRVVGPVEPLVTAPAVTGPLRGSETILVVEDQEEVRTLIRKILEARGYGVLTAEDGPAALQAAALHPGPIHLLLSDVVMPGMSGREVSVLLTTTRTTMRTLYMSGYTDESIVRHGMLEEGVQFLQKPFTAEGLARRVREVLEGG